MICIKAFEVTDDAGAPTGIFRRCAYSTDHLPETLLLELCRHDHRSAIDAQACPQACEVARTIKTENDLLKAIQRKRSVPVCCP